MQSPDQPPYQRTSQRSGDHGGQGRRTRVACLRCRRAKRQCNDVPEGRGACERCLRLGEPCVVEPVNSPSAASLSPEPSGQGIWSESESNNEHRFTGTRSTQASNAPITAHYPANALPQHYSSDHSRQPSSVPGERHSPSTHPRQSSDVHYPSSQWSPPPVPPSYPVHMSDPSRPDGSGYGSHNITYRDVAYCGPSGYPSAQNAPYVPQSGPPASWTNSTAPPGTNFYPGMSPPVQDQRDLRPIQPDQQHGQPGQLGEYGSSYPLSSGNYYHHPSDGSSVRASESSAHSQARQYPPSS